MPLRYQVRRQPGEQEVPQVIASEQSEKGTPDVSAAQDLADSGRRRALDGRCYVVAWPPDHPRNEPEQARGAHGEEHDAPTVVGDQLCADEDSYSRSDL